MAARLSKDGLRVLCCVIDCGTELAWVLDAPIWRSGRMVWFGPGWSNRQEDDVWTTATRRNLRRLRQGRHEYRRRQMPNDARLVQPHAPPDG